MLYLCRVSYADKSYCINGSESSSTVNARHPDCSVAAILLHLNFKPMLPWQYSHAFMRIVYRLIRKGSLVSLPCSPHALVGSIGTWLLTEGIYIQQRSRGEYPLIIELLFPDSEKLVKHKVLLRLDTKRQIIDKLAGRYSV